MSDRTKWIIGIILGIWLVGVIARTIIASVAIKNGLIQERNKKAEQDKKNTDELFKRSHQQMEDQIAEINRKNALEAKKQIQ